MLNKNKKLYNSLIKDISRTIKQKLNEGLFDDFEDLFDIDDSTDELMAAQNGQKTSLLECESINDINDYLIDHFKLINTIKEVADIIFHTGFSSSHGIKTELNPLVQSGKISNVETYGNSYFDDGNIEIRLTINIISGYGVNLIFKEGPSQAIPGLTYRNKPVVAPYIYFKLNTYKHSSEEIICGYEIIKRTNSGNYRWSTSQQKRVPVEVGDHPKLQSMKQQYNNNIWLNIEGKIRELLLDYFNNVMNTSKIFAELEAPGKVYNIKQKDYDRMDNCFGAGRKKLNDILSGFDKITNPDKMLKRVAAYFIAAKNNNAPDQMFKLNDDILLMYFFKDPDSSSKWAHDLRTQIILKLKNFPELHLKDVILTYEAYKDKF